jgi:HAD superfamily hydrolase (TIGR01509 family)
MLRAFIFDIYSTLLEVRPPPPNAELLWSELCRGLPASSPVPSLPQFNSACQQFIAQEHARARIRGVQFPEVYWPDIARAALPALSPFSDKAVDDFLYRHAQLERTVSLMPGAAEVLPQLRRRGSLLGLCSNCQPYTLRELDQAFGSATLSTQLFDPQLSFFSFRAGFSKPDPAAFKLVLDRLATRTISPSQTLVVGDRLDNDIQPARLQGCRTWHLSARPAMADGGDWYHLLDYVLHDPSV